MPKDYSVPIVKVFSPGSPKEILFSGGLHLPDSSFSPMSSISRNELPDIREVATLRSQETSLLLKSYNNAQLHAQKEEKRPGSLTKCLRPIKTSTLWDMLTLWSAGKTTSWWEDCTVSHLEKYFLVNLCSQEFDVVPSLHS